MGTHADWVLKLFADFRRAQRMEFAALPFAEKLARVEQLNEIVEISAAACQAIAEEYGAPGGREFA